MSNLEFFNNRHSVRDFGNEGIGDTPLANMIQAATHAPNTGNMQWYSVIVTRDESLKKALAPSHFNQPCVTSSDIVLTFCIDLLRFEKWCRISGATPGFGNFQSFIAAFIDTCLFAQQFSTIAEMRGLGTCFLGTTTYNAPDIARILKLPERVVPVTTLVVGHPKDKDQGPTWRLPYYAVMHDERYHEPSDDDVRRWYAPLEAESQHFVDENGKQSLAQVFTDIRYPRESAEYFSKVYLDIIRQNGF